MPQSYEKIVAYAKHLDLHTVKKGHTSQCSPLALIINLVINF